MMGLLGIAGGPGAWSAAAEPQAQPIVIRIVAPDEPEVEIGTIEIGPRSAFEPINSDSVVLPLDTHATPMEAAVFREAWSGLYGAASATLDPWVHRVDALLSQGDFAINIRTGYVTLLTIVGGGALVAPELSLDSGLNALHLVARALFAIGVTRGLQRYSGLVTKYYEDWRWLPWKADGPDWMRRPALPETVMQRFNRWLKGPAQMALYFAAFEGMRMVFETLREHLGIRGPSVPIDYTYAMKFALDVFVSSDVEARMWRLIGAEESQDVEVKGRSVVEALNRRGRRMLLVSLILTPFELMITASEIGKRTLGTIGLATVWAYSLVRGYFAEKHARDLYRRTPVGTPPQGRGFGCVEGAFLASRSSEDH